LYGHSAWSHKQLECNRCCEIRKKALAQDRKVEAAWRLFQWTHGTRRARSAAVENEFHFQDARMVF